MAKCEICGQEYPDGTEHVCAGKTKEKKPEAEEVKPAEQNPS